MSLVAVACDVTGAVAWHVPGTSDVATWHVTGFEF